jgi:hypothetical protein
MVPLYAARIEHLGPGDFVRAECVACGHNELIPASALLQGLRLSPTTLVPDLEPRLLPGVRCAREGGGFDQVGHVEAGQEPWDLIYADCVSNPLIHNILSSAPHFRFNFK